MIVIEIPPNVLKNYPEIRKDPFFYVQKPQVFAHKKKGSPAFRDRF